MATNSVQWGQPLVHSDGWEAPSQCDESDNALHEDHFSDNFDDEAEEDYMSEVDDDFYLDQCDDNMDEDDYDDWAYFERDYEYDYREHSGLCTGYNDDYNDDD